MTSEANSWYSNSSEPAFTSSPRSETWILWLLLLCAGAIRCVLAVFGATRGFADDAYVSLRYTSNLVHGLGLVYNPGERVLGTTSPLHVFILAAVAKILGVGHLEAITLTIAIFASLGLVYFSEKFLNQIGIPRGVKWTYLCVLAFLPSFVSNSTSGMETPIVLLLMVLSIYFTTQNQLLAVAFVGVLLFLSRIDTGIWLVALGAHILIENRGSIMRRLATPLVVFLAGIVSWLTFSHIYYGSIIPESVVGKALSHGAFERPDWHYALNTLSAYIPVQRFGAWGFIVFAIALIALIPSTQELWTRFRSCRPMILFVPLYVAIFLASRAPAFSWYVIPPKWAFYLVVVFSLWWWAVRGLQVIHSSLKPEIVMLLASMCLFGLGLNTVRKAWNPDPSYAWPASLCNLINRDVSGDGRIFLEHIGLVGFKTGRYIYDYGGLVTPQTNAFKREYGRKWVTKAVRRYRADVVVLYSTDISLIRPLTDPDAAWFLASYNHVQDYQAEGMVVSVFFLKASPRIVAEGGAKPGSGASQVSPVQR